MAKKKQALKKTERRGKVEIRQLHLVQSGSKLGEMKPNELPTNGTQNIQLTMAIEQSRKSAIINAQIKLSVSYDQAAIADPPVSVFASFLATYAIVEDFADEKSLHEFLQRASMLHIWPYWREFVQSMTVRMGLPAFPIPLINVQELVKDEPKKEATRAKS